MDEVSSSLSMGGIVVSKRLGVDHETELEPIIIVPLAELLSTT
jgi:hypothetical protein